MLLGLVAGVAITEFGMGRVRYWGGIVRYGGGISRYVDGAEVFVWVYASLFSTQTLASFLGSVV